MATDKVKWSRPSSVPFPTVWRRCTGIKKMPNGTIPKFIIQDVPDNIHEDLINFMTENFFKDEVVCENLHLLEDPVSMKELQEVYRKALKERVGLVAFLDEEEELKPGRKPKIAGCNLTAVTRKSDKLTADMFKGRVLRMLIRDLFEYVGKVVNVYDLYGVDEYMSGLGLSVDPIYRGQGLGLEILKARADIGNAIGLRVTMSVFTAVPAQIMAKRCGMEVLEEIFYEDFVEDDGSLTYPNIKSTSFKIIAKRFY